MKKLSIVITAVCCILSCSIAFAQTQDERIQSSYILAFNKSATADEVTYWKTQGNLTVEQLITRHKAFLAANPGIWAGILNVSYTDAFGRVITDDEKKFHIKYPRTYIEMIAAHMKYLEQNPGLYDDVIKRSYKGALGRLPTDDELKYWRGQKKIDYIWLFRAHIEWVRTNVRTNKASLTGVAFAPLSVPATTETWTAISNLVGNDGASIVGNAGSTMVAAGGGNMVAAGGGNMVAAGGGN